MRSFLLLIFVLCGINAQNLVITSGYSSSLDIFVLDENSGELTLLGTEDIEPNFTFMEIGEDGNSVYFVHEVMEYGDFGQTGAVSFWRKGRDIAGNVLFQKMQTFSSDGTGTCHVKLHAEYGLLHLANYAGGSFTSIKLNKQTGEFIEQAYNEYYGMGSNVKPDRQELAHAHGTWTFGPYVYVADLGSDKIWHYKASEDGSLSKAEPAFTATPPGYGPRHMAISASTKKAYIVFELESFVGIYDIDESNGALIEADMAQLMPDPAAADYAAEIEISPSGKHLYVSNRANGAIVVFNILPDGGLDRIQVKYVGGPTPRHFKVHPSGKFLIVALQDVSKVEKYDIDMDSGLIGEPQVIESGNHPTIIGLMNL